MQRRDAPIGSPCSEDWGAMTGDDRTRFCDQCNKQVHNLSAMTETEARAVVAQPSVCVRYQVDPKTQQIRHRRPRRFLLRVATTAGLGASLALPAAAGMATEADGPGLLERAWESLTELVAGPPVEVLGGLEMVPEPPAPPPAVELAPMMGDIAVEPPPPVEAPAVEELGEVAIEAPGGPTP